MFALTVMFVGPAQKAGIKVPDNTDDFVASEYPHFAVFLNSCLGRGMPNPACHWDNARVISTISDDEILKVTLEDLINRGLSIST